MPLRLLLILTPSIPSTFGFHFAPRVHFHWKYINYTWPSIEAYSKAVQDGSYIKEHNVASGVKVWRDRIYLTIPRLKAGVPATLAATSIERIDGDASPLLEPFPSWAAQREEDCDGGLQLVQSMEIDPDGRMWIINNGRTEIRSEEPRALCPSRLIILDLHTGDTLLNHVFPDSVLNRSSMYLNDIVVDHEDGGFAYITDNDKENPGIVVFSLRERRSWKVSHADSMQSQEEAARMTVNGTSFRNVNPVNGIALSQASASRRMVYYFPLASFHLYALPTSVLKSGAEDVAEFVVHVGRKPSQSGGMVMSSSGLLFLSMLTLDSIYAWDTNSPPFSRQQRAIITDTALSQYPDSLTIDEAGRLWYTSNRLQAFRTDAVDTDRVNIRLIVAEVGEKGYQSFADGSRPRLPVIFGGFASFCRMWGC